MQKLLSAFLYVSLVVCTPLVLQDSSSSPPTATLDNASVTGIHQGALSKFLGIPFAEPPYVYFDRSFVEIEAKRADTESETFASASPYQ